MIQTCIMVQTGCADPKYPILTATYDLVTAVELKQVPDPGEFVRMSGKNHLVHKRSWDISLKGDMVCNLFLGEEKP